MGRREGPSEERRQAILGAADRVFGERGYSGASIREIARQAGVSSALLYWFFPDKASLFIAVLTSRVLGDETAAFLPPGFLDLPPETLIPIIAQRYLDMMSDPDQLRLFRLMLTEGQREPELIGMMARELQSRAFVPFGQYLARQVELGRMRDLDPILATQALFGMLISVVLRLHLMRDKVMAAYSNEQIAAALTDIYLHGVSGSGKGPDLEALKPPERDGTRAVRRIELDEE